MTSYEKLEKYFIFEEAILETIETVSLSDVKLQIKISEWNLTTDFFSEWNLPTGHEEARNALEKIMPGSCLVVFCKNVALLKLDRISRHRRPELILVKEPTPSSPDAQAVAKTIFGFGFEEDSELKRQLLGKQNVHFAQLTIDMVDARLEIIFQELEITNFPLFRRNNRQ